MAVEIYGMKNCDTMKKAFAWLDAHGVAYDFHDFKKKRLAPSLLDVWLAQVGWETLLNRKGTMWRKLDDSVREGIDAKSARRVMLETPTIIKRPVLVKDGEVSVGFEEAGYRGIFG